ncbi:MAG TPA: cyclic nucleotide-gated ion channel [Rhizomicrobium sp.]|jgi:voltage-gated potassium channel|nr:cyclic nucleotide-gated ion channel [Rhizomicrobium sp.]
MSSEETAELDKGERPKARRPQRKPTVPPPPQSRWAAARRATYQLLEAGNNATKAAIAFDIFLVVLIVANVTASMLETVPEISRAYTSYFSILETSSLVIFSVEYAARIWSAIEDPRYFRQGPFWGRVRFAIQPVALIDFLAVGPSLLGLFFTSADLRALRVFRLLRILKIVRYSPALTTLTDVIVAERRALLGTLLLLICVMILAAEAMYLLEGSENPKMFGTLPQAMYWAITTLTTVGYGDNYPITAAGKFVAGVTMIAGLGLFALPVGIVATNFVNEIHRRDFVVTWSMLTHFSLFKNLDVDTVVGTMGYLRSQVIREHSVIARRGDRSEDMYFVVSGKARAEFMDGAETLTAGDYFGADAMLADHIFEATVTARTEMRVLTLAANDFAILCRKYPQLRRRFEASGERRREKRARRSGLASVETASSETDGETTDD